MMATFFKNYGELDKTVKNLVKQYKQAKTPNDVVRQVSVEMRIGHLSYTKSCAQIPFLSGRCATTDLADPPTAESWTL